MLRVSRQAELRWSAVAAAGAQANRPTAPASMSSKSTIARHRRGIRIARDEYRRARSLTQLRAGNDLCRLRASTIEAKAGRQPRPLTTCAHQVDARDSADDQRF